MGFNHSLTKITIQIMTEPDSINWPPRLCRPSSKQRKKKGFFSIREDEVPEALAERREHTPKEGPDRTAAVIKNAIFEALEGTELACKYLAGRAYDYEPTIGRCCVYADAPLLPEVSYPEYESKKHNPTKKPYVPYKLETRIGQVRLSYVFHSPDYANVTLACDYRGDHQPERLRRYMARLEYLDRIAKELGTEMTQPFSNKPYIFDPHISVREEDDRHHGIEWTSPTFRYNQRNFAEIQDIVRKIAAIATGVPKPE
jgi:hypothetical protein